MSCECQGIGWIELPPSGEGSWDLIACDCNQDLKLPQPVANWE